LREDHIDVPCGKSGNQPIEVRKYGFPEYGVEEAKGKLDEQDAKLAESSASTSARFQKQSQMN